MQYSPKLKKAMKEIKDILDKNDIAATVVLHTPGHSEFLSKIDPSYSCAFFEGDYLRVRARIDEDFNGDKKAWERKIIDTINMLDLFAHTTANLSISFFEIFDRVSEKVKAEGGGDHNFTSNTTQNN